MPIRIIGMIGVAPPGGTALHVIGGGVSPTFLGEFAQAHENAGFDLVLVGYYSSSAEGFAVASYAASQTTRLGYLIAHRPGLVAPTLAARSIATFDALWGGRLAIHIIAGNSDEDMQRDGDFTPKEERYERAAEYLDVMRRTWTCKEPFDYDGRFYRVRQVFPDVRPVQRPYPELLFGGSSPGALAMGAQQCDTFAMFGEPLAETAERITTFRRMVERFGRPAPKFNVSFRPILGRTEGEAWDKARSILSTLKQAPPHVRGQDQSGKRLVELAAKSDIHDERLWMPVAALSGGKGNTSCLVGTPEQVAEAMLKYYRLGVSSFLVRGFDPLRDATAFGEDLIPRLKEGAAAIDRQAALAA
ncbi:MAG: LLM class flavin-dependent oxidoreductase [Rhodospirillales bacterium]|nr:LLM class flavin-dependent oxidoreductase [Rhodospirillales bacterium]